MDSRCRKRLTDVALSAMSWSVDHLRPRVSFIVLAFFLAFMFVSGIREEVKKHHVQPGRFLIWFDHLKPAHFL